MCAIWRWAVLNGHPRIQKAIEFIGLMSNAWKYRFLIRKQVLHRYWSKAR